MNIDVYCDETLPDLFTSKQPDNKLMLLGSLWIGMTPKN